MCAPVAIPVMAAAMGTGGAALAGASTMGLVASGLMGAATGMSAAADIQAADYNEALAENQQQQLENEAKNVRIAGSQEAGREHIETQKNLARARAEFGGRGVSASTGTPAAFMEDVAEVGALEQMTMLNNASRQAFGLETQGENLVEQAKLEKRRAKTSAFSTILGSAASGYMSGMQFA